MAELRNELIVMDTQHEEDNWETVALGIQNLLCFNYCPRIIILTKKRALLDGQSIEGKERILALKQLQFGEKLAVFSSWHPGLDTLTSDWFRLKSRWITFQGIPYHLLTFETMEVLCSRFGKATAFPKIGQIIGNRSSVRVKVKRCNVKFIPHLIPLVDLGGVVYPIRIFLDIEDRLGDEESSPELCSEYLHGGFGGKKSYADVVVDNRSPKQARTEWVRRSGNFKNLLTVSRVEKSSGIYNFNKF